MTTTSALGEGTDLPLVPVPRDTRCPLQPPPDFAEWRASKGLRLASWRDKPNWVFSRYESISKSLPCFLPII